MLLRYPGGKSKKTVRDQIFSRFPKNYLEFRDVMVGGGGIFFHVPSNKTRWINDLDENLISFYKELKENTDKFIKKCRKIKGEKENDGLAKSKPKGKSLYNARLKSKFDYLIKNKEKEPALSYFFVNRTVWGGRVNYDLKSRLYFSNPSGWNVAHSNKMEKAAKILQEVKITSISYEEVLQTDGEDVLIYIDPPYLRNTNLDKNSRLYKHNFEIEDHKILCENIKKCKHKIILSYDDDPFIRNMYKDFNMGKGSWTYCGTSSAKTHSKSKKTGKELIITNY